MNYRDDHPLTIYGRLLTCTQCGDHIDLIELPEPRIQPHEYVCGTCLVAAQQKEVAA